ncbi:BTAD domain-containing putative transcriptional regulator [Nocardioides cynanchi]|uniref:BTAD domain-containing putative transcriptional regulator n=1 Tax=Nocardioides cynanchi TaxID=2558918 RepID=UPI00177B953C|nr:BTAD domain-containing putative transcriptional regulator [Nocardioides cynanchi]
MEVGVLGPVVARIDARAIDLGTPKQRALIAALALSAGRPVAVDVIVDLLWGDAPPAGVAGTLQAYVSGLRRVLEPTRQRRAPATVLVTAAPGYALRLAAGALDAERFERVVDEQHRRLRLLSGHGPPALSADELLAGARALEEALGLWRGTPYAELEDAPRAVAERTRLEELRLVAREDLAVAELALGRHATVAADLEAMTAEHPLRERLWGLRALALTRAGRQADALQVLREVRDVLDDELGIEPGAELRDLQTAVLRQDPSLEWVPPPSRPGTPFVAARTEPETPPSAPSGADWPMLGRAADLAALCEAWDRARAGTPDYAVLIGEPGIGKSRLAAELVAEARRTGARICVGRCSQDDGAPPLWPWASVLEALGGHLPESREEVDRDEFAAFERIARFVRDAAREEPVLVVLDDLHWADTCSLRVLRLLLETADTGRLMVLVTWRDSPEPTGTLADVAEALARRHAVRRRLVGLEPDAVGEVFATVAHNRPTPDQAKALQERTDGNPFYVVEYARLAGERADLARLLAEERPPDGVQEVLVRRLARLPESTVGALRTAAVIGRRFDAPTLALATGIDPDDLLDVVEPAEAAGLVRDVGVDRFAFAHALVRDTLAAGLTTTRRARVHSRVAEALEGRPERATERALHWRSAGPSYAGRAWRAAVDAAELARRRYAHEKAAELLRGALDTMADDPAATPRDRYDVLMQLIDAYRWAALWTELTGAVAEAVAVGESLGDVELTARAAVATTQGTLWQSAAPGQVHHEIVAALRRSLDRLPQTDDPLRCRVLLGLANELYYGAPYDERRALVDEALAMARRLDDDALLLDACQIAFSSLWRADTARERLGLAEESLLLAERLGNERAHVVSACLRAVAFGELGRPAEMFRAAEVARAAAERLRIPYGLLVIDNLLLPWLAMAGRFDDCAATFERIKALDAQISLDQSEAATAGAFVVVATWRGEAGEAAAILQSMEGGPFPVTATIVSTLWRGGQEDAARAHYAAHDVDLSPEDWFSLLNWGMAADVSLHLDDPVLADTAYARLLPHAGASCCAGSGNHTGPVDLFLALAAAARGDQGLAARHADDAERLCAEWQIPLAAQWLREQRVRYSF